jgi:hypothetical protein
MYGKTRGLIDELRKTGTDDELIVVSITVPDVILPPTAM